MEQNWTEIIEPKKSFFSFNLKELWRYRDLVKMFVKRDFIMVYKQTILGPLWFFIQPLFTTLVMVVVFGTVAGISTDGIPMVLFYLSGNVLWAFFASTLKTTSNTFVANQNLFGKVYFPRIAVPISVILSGLMKFSVQLLLFLGFYLYYIFTTDAVHPNYSLFWLLPLLIILAAGLSFSLGIIISSLTIKYRDLNFLVDFGIQITMYLTPVVYPLSLVVSKFSNYAWIIHVNPMTTVLESFRFVLMGSGAFSWMYLGYATLLVVFLGSIGLLIFNKTEKNFMDVI